jgi:hypothetical protein
MHPSPFPESPHQTPRYPALIVPSSPSRSRSCPHGITQKANWQLPPLVRFAAGIQYTIRWAHSFIEMCIYCRQTDPPLYFPLLSLHCQPRHPAPVVPPLAHPSLPPVPPRHVSQTPPAKGAPGKYPTSLTMSTSSMPRIHTEPIGTMSHLTTG